MQRSLRVNELLKREIAGILVTRYQAEAVGITITEVDTSPNLRKALVYYAILGDEVASREAEAFFRQHGKEIQQLVGKAVILKYLPKLEFVEDDAMARGTRLNQVLDELGLSGEAPSPGELPEEPEGRRE